MNPRAVLAVSLLLSLTRFQAVTARAETRSTLYTRTTSQRVDPDQETLLCVKGTCHGGRRSCVFACNAAREQCNGVNFRPSDGRCVGVTNSLYDIKSTVSEDTEWENFSPDTQDVRDGDWILVFRAQRGVDNTNNGVTLKAWDNDSLRSDDHLGSLNRECYTSKAAGCKDLYRSRWLSSWPSDKIDKVRLALFTDGVQKAEMVFNGTGSDRENWFHTDRLLSSTWTDLVNAPRPNNFTSFRQFQDRHMFVVMKAIDDECEQTGWLLVINNSNMGCRIDTDHVLDEEYNQIFPQFMYTNTTRAINFNEGVSLQKADVLAIFIKLL